MRFCAVSDFDARFVSEAEELEAVRERERQFRMMPKSSSVPSASSASSEDESSRVAAMMRQMQEESRRAAAKALAAKPVVVAAGDPLLCEASPDTKRGAVRCRATRLAREVWASPANLRRCEDWWRGVPVL